MLGTLALNVSVAWKAGCPVGCVSKVKAQGRLGTAFLEVTSAILACVSLAVGGHLITITWAQGRALAREGRGGRASLTASLCTSEFELSLCPHNVVTRAVLLKGEFKSFWQRGKGNLLSAVYEYSQLLRKKKVNKTMTVVSKSQMQAHAFSKQNLLTKLVANAA